MRRRTIAFVAAVGFAVAGLGASVAQASSPPPSGCQPTACTPGATVGLTNGQGQPIPGAATLYGWGAATLSDGSILVGDYWNYRIVHYNADGTPATPFVFTQSKFGFGPDTNQAPFGICVDNSGGPFQGDVYMTEGSLYNVNQYDPSGNWVTSWGTNKATHVVAFDYPSQCVVGPNGLVYIANQWGDKHNPPEPDLVVLNPVTNKATFVSPTSSQYAFKATRSMAFDSAGDIWIANQGHHRIDVYNPSCLQTPWPTTGCLPIKEITPPGGVSTTFDMRGLAIDTATNLAFVANGQNCLVQEFNADPSSSGFGSFVTNFNGVPSGGGDCGTGNGQFEDGARDIAVSGQHQVWVGDLGYFRAQVFDESGNYQFIAPATPNPDLPPTGGFNGPRGVAFDSSGDMYVTDTFNERIEEFIPNGSGGYTYDREWGLRGDTASTMNYPRLLCVDPQTGNLIVANTDSSTAVAWNVSVDPPKEVWAYGTLKTPYGLACSSTGTVYVADSNDSDIVALTSAGSLLGTIGSAQNMGFVRGIWVDSTDGSVWVDTSATGGVYHFAQWSNGGGFLGSFNINASIPSAGVFGITGNAGYLYIALSSANQVAEYTRSGALVGTFGGAGTKVGQMRTPQGLAVGPDGNLYVVEENNNRVSQWSVPPAQVSPASYVATIGGPGHAGMYPSGAEVAPSGAPNAGDIVVADTGNDRVAEYTTGGTLVWQTNSPQVANEGSLAACGTNPGYPQFEQPRDVGVDSLGNVYVADNGNGRIVLLSGATGKCLIPPIKLHGGAAIGITVSSTPSGDMVYAANAPKNDIMVFNTSGALVQTLTSSGACVINRARDAAADSSGDVYVANYENNNILEFSPTGSCITTFGAKGNANGQFKNPYGVAIGTDPYRNSGSPGEAIYVADSNNERIQEFTPSGVWVASIGSAGSDAQAGTFTQLRRVAVDANGNIWGADLWGERVEEWTRSPAGYTYSAMLPNPFVGSGNSSSSLYNQVRGIGFDGADDLISVDTVNQRLAVMSPTGSLLGECGTRGFTTSSTGQPGFNWPRGVAVDPATGDYWVADTKQSDIQVIQPYNASTPCAVVARLGKVGTALGADNYPDSIAIGAGYAWIADTKNHRIESWNVTTQTAVSSYTVSGGLASTPAGVAIDPTSGNLFVADGANDQVLELSVSAGSVTGTVRTFTDGFNAPFGVAANGTHVAVADRDNNRIIVFDESSGNVVTTITGSDITGGGATALYHPENVAMGPNGNLFIADTYNDRILEYTLS